MRQGKYFELDLDDDRRRARRGSWRDEIADKLLANPVIESYRIEVEDCDMKFGVVVFPGSNCDHDAYYAAQRRARRRTPSSSGTRTPI